MEGGEDGDGDAGADREAGQGGVEEVVDHALAQCEQRPVVGDGAVGHGSRFSRSGDAPSWGVGG